MLIKHGLAGLVKASFFLASSDPAADEIGHPNASPIVLTFDGPVTLGTGNIILRKANRAGTFSDSETFDAAATQGTGPGEMTASGSTLTIYPTSPEIMMKYAIRIPATAISGFAGIFDDSTLQYVSDTGTILPSKTPGDYTTVIQNQTFTTQQDYDTGDSDTLILNCTFDMTGEPGGTYGARVRNVDNLVFADCDFLNIPESGILFRNSGSTTNCAVIDCTFTDIDNNGIQSAKVESTSIDHTGLIISGNTLTRTGQGSVSGGTHGLYIQATDAVMQNNQILDEVDGNGISFRCAGLIFNNTIDSLSRSGTDKACIRYFGDHLSGNHSASTRDEVIKIAWNTIDGQSDFAEGVNTFKPGSPTLVEPYTEGEWYANDIKIWGNTVSNVTTDYSNTGWTADGYINIETDGVTDVAGGGTTNFVDMKYTVGETANPFSKSGFSVVSGNKYLILVASTVDSTVTGVDLGAVAATLGDAGGGSEGGESITTGVGVISTWIATANTTGSVAVEATQSSGGTKDIAIAVYDVTGLALVDDDGDTVFDGSGISTARIFGAEGGSGVFLAMLALWDATTRTGEIEPNTNISVDDVVSTGATIFACASVTDSIASGSAELSLDTGSISGAAHGNWLT